MVQFHVQGSPGNREFQVQTCIFQPKLEAFGEFSGITVSLPHHKFAYLMVSWLDLTFCDAAGFPSEAIWDRCRRWYCSSHLQWPCGPTFGITRAGEQQLDWTTCHLFML